MDDQSRWTSLEAAIAQIQSVTGWTSVRSQQQLKMAIADSSIPVKWADSKGPKDTIKEVSYLAGMQLVLSEEDLAWDGDEIRPLLLLRSAIDAILGEQGHPNEVAESSEISTRFR